MEEQTRYPGKYCKFTLNGRVVKSCLSSSSIPVTSYYLLKIINFFFVSAITNFQLDKIEFKMKLQFHFFLPLSTKLISDALCFSK